MYHHVSTTRLLLSIFEPINLDALVDELRNPADCHPKYVIVNKTLSEKEREKEINVLAPLRISKILMIPDQMLLIPRIILDLLIVLGAAKHNLAEAVVVGDIGHLRVHDLVHQFAG